MTSQRLSMVMTLIIWLKKLSVIGKNLDDKNSIHIKADFNMFLEKFLVRKESVQQI